MPQMHVKTAIKHDNNENNFDIFGIIIGIDTKNDM